MIMTAYLKEYTNTNNNFGLQPGKQELILMLLDGIVQKIDAAKNAHDRGELTEKGFYLGRATNIVDALRNMLDLRSGGQVAQDLETIYHHVDLLLQAAIDPAGLGYLDEAAEIIENMAIGCNLVPPEMQLATKEVMHA
jgi:flagellar protein FliS